MHYVVFEEEEVELNVNDLIETYPDIDSSALEEYLSARKELETLRGKLAEKEARATTEEESGTSTFSIPPHLPLPRPTRT